MADDEHSYSTITTTTAPSTNPPLPPPPVVETLYYRRCSVHAFAPTKATPLAAGFDLYSSRDVRIPANGRAVVHTDLQVKIPAGYYGRLAPRSGLAFVRGMHVGAGVIDRDYEGVILILLFNLSDADYMVKKGERAAQLILEKIAEPVKLEECDLQQPRAGEDPDHRRDTPRPVLRGKKGLGSSGK